MKQYKIIFIAVLLCLTYAGVQAQTIAKSVVAGAGGSFSGSGIMVDWTAGQPVINYATPSALQVTEGFHPIAANYTAGPLNTTNHSLGNQLVVAAYPNPVTNILHVSIQQVNAESVSIQVDDVIGNVEKTFSLDAQLNIQADLDLSSLDAGIYYLIVNEHAPNSQVMKIVKY